MKDEISAAVTFLIRLIDRNTHLPSDKVEQLREKLFCVLIQSFQDHWFPDQPFKGQAYRCIRINGTEHRDSKLETAARQCGLKYEDLKLPLELTIWVDPEEVCCRFGEFQGSYCTVASFKGDTCENYVDQINTEELEQKSVERAQQATFEILGGRQFTPKLSFHKNHIKHFGVPHPSSFRSQYQALYGSSPPSQYKYESSPPTQRSYTSVDSIHYNSSYPSKYGRGTLVSNGNGSYVTYSTKGDRYHWVSKSVVKA